MATGKIKTLYSDKEKTEVLFPKTKTSAVSDENGRGLDSLIKDVSYFSDTNSSQIEAVPNDADTLGGRPASEYATQNYVKDKIIEAQFSSNGIDVSNFVKKEDLEQIDFPVDSVNGKTGAVTLSADDVGARPNTWLPTIAEIGAAPAGYGLGGGAYLLTSANNLNTIKENGWYSWNSNSKPSNAPTGSGTNYLDMMRVTGTGAACIQEVFDISDSSNYGLKMQRTIYGNNYVSEWEWINPPMTIGVEYRTTERWNGQIVYTALIDCGFTTTSASIQAPTGATRIIRHNAWSGRAALPIYDYINQSSYFAYTYLNTDDITIFYKADNKSDGYGNGGYHWYCQMWYSKQ